MIKNIIVDVDEVLLDWLGGFSNYLKKNHGIITDGKPDDFCLNSWVGLPDSETKRLVDRFNSNDQGFAVLKPLGNSEKYLPMLYNDGFKITALSACSNSRDTFNRRQYNLLSIYGSIFEKIILVNRREEKYDYLKSTTKSYVIEDNYDTALIAYENGHMVFLMDQPYNRLFFNRSEEMVRVNDWKTIFQMISKPPLK